MLWRKSKARQAKRAATSRLPSGDEVRDQVSDLTDELGEALESAKEAISRAMSSAGRRGVAVGSQATRRTSELGKEVSRKGAAVGAEVGKKARRRARSVAREAADRLPEPEQVADLTRRATERLFPETAKQHRKAGRRRARRRMLAGAGLAGLGVLAGWLTAPRKGEEARQALKERANATSERFAGMRSAQDTATQPGVGLSGAAASGTTEPQQAQADVTPIHQPDGGAPASKRS